MVRQFLNAKTTSGKLIVEAQGFFGARPLLRWRNREVAVRLTLPFTVAEDGKYAIRLSAMQDPAYGLYTIFIDKKKMGEADFRGPEENELDLPLGVRKLAKGEHVLVFLEAKLISPPGEPTKAKSMTVEAPRLLKLPKKAVRKVKDLRPPGAFRAAGPRPLALRLSAGLRKAARDARRNGQGRHHAEEIPQRRKRRCLGPRGLVEGDAMVVESVGPVHWEHRWTCLDPRR